MTRYVFPCTITVVEERTRVIRVAKDGTPDYEVIGYFAILSRGNVAIYLGTEEPTFKPGDQVRLILEPAQ